MDIGKIIFKLCLLISFSFFSANVFAKTTVTWWAEANADRDPVFQLS